jgi:hypothetical protein
MVVTPPYHYRGVRLDFREGGISLVLRYVLLLHLKKGSSSNSRNGFDVNFHGAWFNTTVIDIMTLVNELMFGGGNKFETGLKYKLKSTSFSPLPPHHFLEECSLHCRCNGCGK